MCLCGEEESSEQGNRWEIQRAGVIVIRVGGVERAGEPVGNPLGINDRVIVIRVCSIVWLKCTVFDWLSSEP